MCSFNTNDLSIETTVFHDGWPFVTLGFYEGGGLLTGRMVMHVAVSQEGALLPRVILHLAG